MSLTNACLPLVRHVSSDSLASSVQSTQHGVSYMLAKLSLLTYLTTYRKLSQVDDDLPINLLDAAGQAAL